MGTHSVSVDPDTLPPFYALGQEMLSVQVPQAGELNVPATLPIGDNRPNTYMAFGNSITDGSGHTDGLSYRGSLQEKLTAYFGRAEVINQGVGSTSSEEGAARIGDVLRFERPAYTLIHYGTNDFNRAGCRRIETLDTCFTLPSLRTIVQEVRAAGSLPVLATIIPCNTGFDFRAPPQRNQWVSIQDEKIRSLVGEEGALLADLEALFLQAGPLDTLFEDHVHPNVTGFELMAQGFFDAIAHGRTPASFSPLGVPTLFRSPASSARR
jgi:lysophospholipase L1-like esterase